jgi:iron complex outermembrane receptor protein
MIRTLTSALVASTCLVVTATPATAQTRDYNVPAGSLRRALDVFARQSGRQVIYRGDEVRSARSPGVRGGRTAEAALDAIVAGSGFTVKADRSGAFAILRSGTVQTGAGDASRGAESSAGPGSSGDTDIVVTGTNIRGVALTTSPVVRISREDIRRTGYTDTAQLAASVPQNYGGGTTGTSPDGVLGPGARAINNFAAATSFNLRGLGVGATLTLVNGNRVAPSLSGTSVDISLIPLAAIERIEILGDGGSAIYGTDAVAGVANIILRKRYDGGETNATLARPSSGQMSKFIADQVIGKTWATGNIFAAFRYERQGNLQVSERGFTADARKPADIIPSYNQHSGLLNFNQELTSKVRVGADALVSDKIVRTTSTAANGTFRRRNEHNQFNLNGYLTYNVFADWELTASGTFSHSQDGMYFEVRPTTPAGTFLGDLEAGYNERIIVATAKADGTLFALPGGNLKAALGFSHYNERLAASGFALRLNPYHPSRNVDSVFAELYAPVLSADNRLGFVEGLILSGGIRHDRYSDAGNTTNFKVGAKANTSAGISLRVNYGTSFRAPNLLNKVDSGATSFIFTYPFASPTGSGNVNVFALQGSGGNLRPETSRNWNLGVEIAPHWLPGAKVSVDYYRVDYSDRIITPPFDTGALRKLDTYGSLITPLSSDAAAAAFLAQRIAQGGQFLDFTGSGSTGVRYIYDARLLNASRVQQSGIDILAQYQFNAFDGKAIFKFNGAIINEIETAFAPGAKSVDISNTYSNPLRFRARNDVSWSNGVLTFSAATNFSNRYRDTSRFPESDIAAFFTVDAAARFEPKVSGGVFQGTTFSLSVQNLFDRDPPYVLGTGVVGIHYDVGTASPLGRFINFSLSKRW